MFQGAREIHVDIRLSGCASTMPNIDAVCSPMPWPRSRVLPMVLVFAPALVDSSAHAIAWATYRREVFLRGYRSRLARPGFELRVYAEPDGQALDI